MCIAVVILLAITSAFTSILTVSTTLHCYRIILLTQLWRPHGRLAHHDTIFPPSKLRPRRNGGTTTTTAPQSPLPILILFILILILPFILPFIIILKPPLCNIIMIQLNKRILPSSPRPRQSPPREQIANPVASMFGTCGCAAIETRFLVSSFSSSLSPDIDHSG
ncbi:MAG: hypothetical protein J3R72DRAFT_443372 [Linnemannia gamsii]|nr:MAG: hypothetical protein J3R72DRAFT_443372 [Linnemannia gamsii]